ncbi:hypothetical protein OH492_08070 [Vibrio chagasii]|nr:hypothetical protein [Vibrio chagasii]
MISGLGLTSVAQLSVVALMIKASLYKQPCVVSDTTELLTRHFFDTLESDLYYQLYSTGLVDTKRLFMAVLK